MLLPLPLPLPCPLFPSPSLLLPPDSPYKRLHKTQLQELLGYYLTPGRRWGVHLVAFIIAFYWFGR